MDFGCFAPLNVFIDIFCKQGVEITTKEARAPMGMLKIDHIRAILQMERVGREWRELYGKAPTEEDVSTLYRRFEPALLSILPQYCDVLEGVIETCAWLRHKKIQIGSTTGYTAEMMKIVCAGAKTAGYSPDCIVTAADVGGGRPQPFMIYENMRKLRVFPPQSVIKVGDTISDIQEGMNAGVWSVGVVIGSSQMGLSRKEWERLSPAKREVAVQHTHRAFKKAGADFIIRTMNELPALINTLNKGEISA